MTRRDATTRWIAVAAIVSCWTLAAGTTQADAALELTRVAKFDDPVETVAAPGPSARGLLFVAERDGRVRVVQGGETRRRPFLDISDRVRSADLEQGLLSIAFDPRYEQNGRFYVYFTASDRSITIERYLRDPDDPLHAERRSGEPVLTIPHPASDNHNGGTLAFGSDGDLWISTGDGHPACDPPENAQDTESLLGKLLRIDPVARGYAIPPDNPFVGSSGADEVYAYGLRNPYRFSIDPRHGGTIAIGDVGQFRWEEIDLISVAGARGANFGWDAYEGDVPLALEGPCSTDLPTAPTPDPVFPVATFPHTASDPRDFSGCAVIGGVVVRDPRLPRAIRGRYIYSDHCRGRLRSFEFGTDPPTATGDHYVGLRVDYPTAITAGRRDRIFVTTRFGTVFRIDPAKAGGRRG
ncbi:MAG: PQQ-dependent sugar dehydrogenase [Solirubrobacterales bacterium]|nr:PQQ-dependent sugar dehydrogenase [Solirubrobacterales bacterium]